MRVKKITAMLLAGVLMATSFTGCGVEFFFIKDNNSGSAIISIDDQEYNNVIEIKGENYHEN